MSFQWEVVGGKKAKTNGHQSAKLSKSEKKKFAENAPKAEDILPLVEVKTLYTTLDKKKKTNRDDSNESNKQNGSSQAGKVNNKPQQEASNKPTKPKKQPTPPPKPKDESPEQKARKALKSVEVAELSSLVESDKQQYPDEPSVWLRFLATSLTAKLTPAVWGYLNIEDLGSSILELCPGELKKLLFALAKDLDPTIRQAFYENCLSAIANDVSKDLKVDGWLLLVEVLSHVTPDLAVTNLARYESLMVSYQNRPVVGKSLLWALGQAGMRNLAIGIKTWHAIFRPRSDTKNYAKVVVNHFCTLIKSASTKSKNVAENTINLEQYRNYLHLLISKAFVSHPAVDNAFKALQVLAAKTTNPSVIFEELFNQFEDSHFADGDKAMKQVMEGLTWCLKQDIKETGAAWISILNNKSFSKALATTFQLLKYLEISWNNFSTDLADDDKLRDGFECAMKLVLQKCDTLKGDAKVPSQLCSSSAQIAQNLINRLKKIEQENPRKMGGFPWKTANLILIIAISSIVAYDVHLHKGFDTSSTGIFLKNTGALHYGQIAWDKTREYYQVGYKWGEKEIPPVWAKYGAPTWAIVKEQSIKLYSATHAMALNIAAWASETWPKVLSTIDEYAPGLTDKVADYGKLSWQYTKEVGAIGYGYALSGVSWINTTAFDGQLSTEYLSKMSLAAYNKSHSFAMDTYQWISQMVLPLKPSPTKSS